MAYTADSPAQSSSQLSGYLWGDLIYQGAKTAVYRAVETSSQQPVVIKYLYEEYPSFGELVQFRNQYTITQNLSIPGIVRPLGLEPFGNGYALIMEDSGGISLEQYAEHGAQEHGVQEQGGQPQPLSFIEALSTAIQLADILHELHQHRVIHKDIKPANILIHPDSKRITLIDFSIASLLPKETQAIQSPKNLEGTLAYLAPEQTGRMNRGIDYRADFYALGVTLFQLLTGKLPFTSEDPMELIHHHIAQSPTSVNQLNPEIPSMVADLVAKLMAKNAEDRYQSALGLKHDLERCLIQWKEQGAIASFELGQRDLCDRFLIPEKLYGRESEVQTLLDAFGRVAEGQSEMMLVAGFSGIGKTAIINEVHKPIVKNRGYCIKGKFDQFNRNIPFSAFVQACRSLMGQILSESDAELQAWKSNILAAVGTNGQLLIDVIPELELVIGQQPAVPELSSSAAQNRFNLLFDKFIAVFTNEDHPLVMFLDDLQWADSASLDLMKVLMGDSDRGYLLLLGAYRDNEVFPAHPLMLSLAELTKQDAVISTITLAPLSGHYINQLVAETLSCSVENSQPLTALVSQKTQGNPFFVTQFLTGLYEDELIAFNPGLGYWECDLVKVRDAFLTDDVVEFMAQRLQKLPTSTQEVLKLAACMGNQFDLETLAIVNKMSAEAAAADIWSALHEGLVVPMNETYKFFQGNINDTPIETETARYRFLHDRVQQAAYCLIPEEDIQKTHFIIGQLLLQNLSLEMQTDQSFEIVGHWNKSIELIIDAGKLDTLIQLNIIAGKKARGSAAFSAALSYFKTALSLLEQDIWETNYGLALKLHELNAEAAFLAGDFELMKISIEKILIHSKSSLDCVKSYEIRIQAHMAQRQLLDALNSGIEFLNLLGVEVPKTSEQINLKVEISHISQMMEGKAVADLASLPLIENENHLAKINILANLLPPCYQANPSLFPWLVLKLMQLSIKYGNTPQSSYIYSCYGMLCLLILQDFDLAQEYGKIACQLDVSFATGDGVRGTFVAGSCLTHYSTHVKETFPLLLNSYQSGIETGNFQFGGYALFNRAQYFYLTGANLSEVKQEILATSNAMMTLKQRNTLTWSQTFEQAVVNLLEKPDTPWELVGDAYDENDALSLQIEANDRTGLHYVYLNKMILCYLFEQIPQAIENANLANAYLDGVVCFLNEFVCNFYDSLTQLAFHPHAEASVQSDILKKVHANQLVMESWTIHAPMNSQHKYDLVDAELNHVMGNTTQAIELYDRAIAGAKENDFVQEEALANELAAKFYLNWDKERVAAGYMQEAYYCYSRWEANAKVADLEARYPELLSPILRSQNTSEDVFNALMTIDPKMSVHAGTSQGMGSDASLNQTMDFASILKASQALSGTIQLDVLLRQLTQIMLQNSGSDRCALILPSNAGEWQVRAIATPDKTDFSTAPLEGNTHIPVQLIRYVKQLKEVVVIDDNHHDLPIHDDYLIQHQPKSTICFPLLNQTKLVGIVYLSNQFNSGVFTRDHIAILNLLANQAAVALINAQLYAQSQEKSRHLKASQKRLEQSESYHRNLFEQSSIGLLLCRMNGDLVYANHAFADILGRETKELPALTYWEITPQKYAEAEQAQLESLNKTGCYGPYEKEYIHKDGHLIPVRLSGVIVERDNEQLIWSSIEDISDRKRAEETVLQKSRDLEIALAELQNAQLKMVQSEKMSALGGLVAGVAHEINNPVGCIIGNVGATKHYIEDLLHLIDLYAERLPDPDEVLEEELEEIDLDYVKEDLPKLIQAMKDSGERIKSISKSLRTFSRADTETKQVFDLREGLESTVLILRHRLKGNDQRPTIKVVTEYGEIPEVTCFPGQLNQVFMNILANAIDALDEASQGRSFAELKANPHAITICTELETGPDSKQVKIVISDNGPGIPEAVKAKMFDHLFTTKGVGKGTGLGLAIARQIVVESHGGTLEVQSEEGQGTALCIHLPI